MLEDRRLLATIILNPIADGLVADRNLDGSFETALVSDSSITNRWFNDPSIGQERGVFEYDLSQIPAGTQLSSAKLRMYVNAYTAAASSGPQFRVSGYNGDGFITTADGSAPATLLAFSTINALGVNDIQLLPSQIQSFLGRAAGVRVENTGIDANWLMVRSMENSLGSPVQLVLETSAPPIVVSPVSGLTTTEAGGAATFTVVLSQQPTSEVSIAMSSSDLSEGTVSTSSLVFTSANWSIPQVVTITGVDDIDLDGNIGYSIVTAPAVSSDPIYNGYNASDVSVTNLDREWTQLSLSNGNLVITDITSGGKNDTLTIQSDTANNKFIVSDPSFTHRFSAIGISGAIVSPDFRVVEIPFSSVTGSQITVNTLDGNDSLIVDYSLGNFTKSIGYNSGAQTASDSLSLVGGTFSAVTNTFSSETAGTIDVSGNSQIVYTGLESATDSLIATDRIFTFTAGAESITLSDAGGANMTIDSTFGAALTFANPSGSMTINGGTGSDTISVISVDLDGPFNASMSINGDAGSDEVSLIASINLAPGKSLDVDLQNDAAAGDADRLIVASTGHVRASGTGTITLKATRDIFFSNNSSLEVVDGNLVVAANQQATSSTGFFPGVSISGALLRSTGTGNITVLGRGGNNSSTSSRYGVFMQSGGGVESTSTAAGAGTITIVGSGGPGALGNYGVRILGSGTRVTSASGDIQITGTGGNGTGDYNGGILVDLGSAVRSTGTGANAANITLTGNGARGGGLAVGVHIDSATISTRDGDILLNGTGGLGSGLYNIGVDVFGAFGVVESTGTGPSAGTITINGTGGSGTNFNAGVFIDGGGRVKSVDGAVQLNGSAFDPTGTGSDGIHIETAGGVVTTGAATVSFDGAAANPTDFGIAFLNPTTVTLAGPTNSFVADRMSFDTTGATISAFANAIAFRPKTNGIAINLGGADTTSSLGLSNAELNSFTAGTIQIGDSNSGAISVSAFVARASTSNFELTSGSNINFNPGSLSTGGGTLVLKPGPSAFVQPISSGQEIVATILSFSNGANLAIPINGTAADTQYRQLQVAALAKLDLTGVNLVLSGSFTPAASDNFMIVDNQGTNPITGTFNGLPEGSIVNVNGVNKIITYVGGNGNDVVLGSPTLDLSFAAASIAENAGAAATLGTVTRRNSDTSQALIVNLSSSDTTEATVLASVVIPAGQISASFSIDAVDDTVSDGSQLATIVASASGYLIGTGTIEVTDAPTISDLLDQSTLEDTSTAPISFTAGDSSNLILIGSSSNTLLVPNGNIVFGGSGATRTVTVTPAPNQYGTTTITVIVNDNGNLISDTFLLNVAPVNDAPVAGVGGPYVAAEGSSLVLDASSSFDLQQPNLELTYAWDLNYNGVSFDIDATGISPSVSFADNFATRSIAVRVTDSGGLSSIATTTLTVNNAAPIALVTGSSGGVSGQTRVFTLSASDPSSVDQAANFTFNVDWGDNTTQIITGPVGSSVGHTYVSTGVYVVRITATDKDGATGAPSIGSSITIAAAQIQGNDLMIGGTLGNDSFTLTPGAVGSSFTVKLGTATLGTFTLGTTGAVNVFGQSGTDSVTINGRSVADTFRVTDLNTIALNGIDVRSTGIEGWQLNGLGGTDTLIGPDLNNVWQISSLGGGSLSGAVRFATMENLTGGLATDTFKFNPGGSVCGIVNGGAGTNVLDYSSMTSAVVVNLASGTASSLDGVANITVVVGGSGNDSLTGGNAGSILLGGAGSDTLQGGSGRDLLVGGSNSDVLRGGAGDDILFGGTTSYFNESTKALDLASLDAIFRQWTRTDLSYSTRISNLLSGGAGALINSNKFTTDANAPDDLFGEGGQDWYLVNRKDKLRDNQSNETVTNI